MPTSLFVVLLLKSLVELVGMFFVGQGLLYIFAGAAREGNFVYQLFKKGTAPVMELARAISPRVIAERHLWLVALAILFWAWVVLLIAKANLCGAYPGQCT